MNLSLKDEFGTSILVFCFRGNGKLIWRGGRGHSKPCAELVQFLAFGGFRITEAKYTTWADCDFARGEPETGLRDRRSEESREMHMIPEMRQLLERMKSERPDELKTAAVMRVRECQRAMDRAAKVAGIARITHHDLRQLFATRRIESGMGILTVSRWLGHRDSGALAMKVYGHLRDQHSASMTTLCEAGVVRVCGID